MSKKIFIVSGGTGGHIIPAYCLAKFLQQEKQQVLFFGDKKIKNYIKPEDGLQSFVISSSQFNKSPFLLLKAALKISLGVLQSIYFIASHRPDYIFAFGGYATFPMLIACALTKRKIIIHEQNAHLGKVNRIFARFAQKIALSFARTTGIKPEFINKTIFTGNPVRQEIIELNKIEYTLPSLDYEEQKSNNKLGYNVLLNSDFYPKFSARQKFSILVIGGSGGAKIFSEILPKAFFNFPESIKEHLKIFQQCRPDLVESTFNEYKSFNINIVVDSFFKDMAQLIKEAHLVIARAGSSSIFEFCCARKPMIIVPFANSADNHQQKNADFLTNHGAGIVITEEQFTIQKISEVLNELFSKKEILFKMSKNAGDIAVVDSVHKLALLIK